MYKSAVNSPPVVIVLSEVSIKILFFPYVDKDGENRLIECIVTPDIPLWSNGDSPMPNLDALVLLLVLCNNERQSLSIEYKGGTPKKLMEGHIKSDVDILKEKHEEELRKVQEELEERMRKEREKLEEQLKAREEREEQLRKEGEQLKKELMLLMKERKRQSQQERVELAKRQV